jgi:hypothetical protein
MEEGGVELPPVRVYGDFIGGVVEAGRHRVTFTFAPAAVRQGLRISLASLGLTVALTMAIGRGHWRAASAHRSHASAVHG